MTFLVMPEPPPTETNDRRRRVLRSAFCAAHRAVAAAWVAGTLLIAGVASQFAPEAFVSLLVISIGSAVIAHAALIPGNLIARTVAPSSIVDGMVAWLAGTLVRLFGTVALVGWCCYHMAELERDGLLLGTVLGWYVTLTFVEVWVLSRAMPEQDVGPSKLDSGEDESERPRKAAAGSSMNVLSQDRDANVTQQDELVSRRR